jgi:hypothetical protein
LGANFFPTDPDENAASLANLSEILFGCLDAIEAKAVVEIGAFHGKSTNEMLAWARRSGARVTAIDPAPQPDLREIAAEYPELDLLETTSHDALPALSPADAVIVDGDHNYFTLSEELRLIAERMPGAEMPLVICHDIGWPLARRDAYYAPERIPPEHRQPLAHDVFIVPGDPGVAEGGMPFACVAEREGGPRNGILTAIEDFLADHGGVRFASVPAFFGLGVLWNEGAPWAASLAQTIAPWDANPILERLESNRVRHMVERYRMTRRLEVEVDRGAERDEALRAMLGSRAFAAGEALSRLHGRGRPAFSREQLRRALGD